MTESTKLVPLRQGHAYYCRQYGRPPDKKRIDIYDHARAAAPTGWALLHLLGDCTAHRRRRRKAVEVVGGADGRPAVEKVDEQKRRLRAAPLRCAQPRLRAKRTRDASASAAAAAASGSRRIRTVGDIDVADIRDLDAAADLGVGKMVEERQHALPQCRRRRPG